MADEAHRLGEAELLDLGFERLHFLAVATERQRHRLAAGAQPRHRIDQEVGALDVPELADVGDIGGISRHDDRLEFVGGDAVEYAAHQPFRYTDGALIGVARERALEQEQFGVVHQPAFQEAVEGALERIKRVME